MKNLKECLCMSLKAIGCKVKKKNTHHREGNPKSEKGLRVLLVYPHYECFATAPPLGLAYIATVLEQHHYKVAILDLGVQSDPIDIVKTIKRYDIVGISFLTPMTNERLEGNFVF